MELVYTFRTRWIVVLFLLVEGILMNQAALQYVSIGETIHIQCLLGNVNIWQKFKTQFILAVCGSGSSHVHATISNRMSVSDTCNILTINNFTMEDVGTYRCFTIKDTKKAQHDINVTLRTLTIAEANGSSIINRKVGENVTLTCYMNEAKPDAFIYWRAAETVLQSNRSNLVIYHFQTQLKDDKKQFVCSSNNSGIDHHLEAKVQLNIILRPRVAVVSSPSLPTVKKGHTISLLCLDKSGNNGTINSFVWSHNGTLLPSNSKTIQFTSVKIEDAGMYKCTAKNTAGEDSSVVKITVTFPAIVENETVVFKLNKRPRILQCKVSGFPDTYSYNKWLHYTQSNQLVRSIDGHANGTLLLPYDDPDDLMYEDSGIYICNVTNNITDEDGHLWQTGGIQAVVKGKPVLTKQRKYSYTGHLNETSSLELFVLSSSNVSKACWFNDTNHIVITKECALSATRTEYFGKILNVSAYKCKFEIPETKLKDFQNYTVKIINEFGDNSFTIELKPGQEPPTNIKLHSSANNIKVEFEPGFNGGYPQTFIIEYRKAASGPWTQLEVDNSHTNYIIKYLDQGTQYELRMYSFSKLGNSTISDNYSIYTMNAKDDSNSSGTMYIGFTLGCTLLVCLVVIWWRYRRAKNNDNHGSGANEQQNQGEGLVLNQLNGSAVELQGSSSVSASGADVYSSIDKRKENLDNRDVTYKVATDGKRKKKRRPDRKEWKRNNETGFSKLNYIDVVFEQNPRIGTFYIHGAENRTPYADIDFSAKAEPLISSDESDGNSNCLENNCDDFVCLEDVQQWNITED